MTRLTALLCFVCLAAGCAPRVAGLERRGLVVDGRHRSYELYVPAGLPPGEPVPLLVALHRYIANGNDMAYMSGFNEIADREGFIVIYPTGPAGQWDTFGGDYRDDSRIVLAAIEDVAATHPIDRERIYVTGASNGGFMSYILVCTEPETFAAAAPVMGLMPAALADTGSSPVPILIVHGTDDAIVGYDASSILGMPTLTVEEAVAYWVRRNGCDPDPVVEQLADRDPQDGTRVTVERYSGGRAPVALCRVEGGGHSWPGGKRAGVFSGRLSRDIEVSELIWGFFNESRPPSAISHQQEGPSARRQSSG